jgi:hypothetical protein
MRLIPTLASLPNTPNSASAVWIQACKDEFGWLCQGHGMAMPTGTDTMFFIPVTAVPKGKKVTYLKIVAAYRPEKANPHRIHFTVSSDRIDYPGDVSTKTADLPTVKTLLKQRHFYTQRALHDSGFERLLPQYTTGTIQIHAYSHLCHP